MNHKETGIVKDREDSRFKSSPMLSQAAGLQLIRLGAMQMVMITLNPLKINFVFLRKGNNITPGLFLKRMRFVVWL